MSQLSREELAEHLRDLRRQHRDLDSMIRSLEDAPSRNQLEIKRLKKRKLLLKDEIKRIEDSLLPDIIA